MTTKICSNCNNVFEAIGKGSQITKYCPTCRPFSRKFKDLRRSLTRPGAHGKIPCPECGKPMCPKARWCRSCWHKKSVEIKAYPQGRKHHWYKNGKPKTSVRDTSVLNNLSILLLTIMVISSNTALLWSNI